MLGGRGPEPDLEYGVSVSFAVALNQISAIHRTSNLLQRWLRSMRNGFEV